MDSPSVERRERFLEDVRALVRREIEPAASDLDRAGSCPASIVDALAGCGLLGACVPEGFGGAGQDYLAYVAALEELSAAWAALGAIVSIHNTLVCGPILEFGSEAQKHRYLPRLTRERQMGCYAFAEQDAGSDAGGIRTTATADGDCYVLDGEKVFVTNARLARLAIVYAVTDPPRGREGLSAFIVDMDTRGLRIAERQDKMGLLAAETHRMEFDGCRVPKEHLLGEPSGGFAIARAVVARARIDVAAQSVGIARACLEQSVRQAKTRRQFGRAIADFEAIQWMLADMSTEIDAARLLTARAAAHRAAGREASMGMEASMAKLFASEAANRAAYNAVQVFGGHGYLKEAPVERYFRDARAMTLFEETSEIDRLVIEHELTGRDHP